MTPDIFISLVEYLTVVVSNIMLALIESDAPLESMQLDMGILGKDNLRFEER
jgi:hypothetical protein